MGTEENKPESKETTPSTGTSPAPDTETKNFSQDDVSRIAAKEKGEGRNAGRKEILDELGVTDLEDIKAIIKAKEEAEQAAMSEAQKAQAAAEKARGEAEAQKAEATKIRFEAKVERELIREGVDAGKVDRVTKMLTIDVNADDDLIKSSIEELKKDFPNLFESNGTQGPVDTNTGGKPPSQQGGNKAKDAAKDRLASRHPQRQTS
jgi:hypothetical protein